MNFGEPNFDIGTEFFLAFMGSVRDSTYGLRRGLEMKIGFVGWAEVRLVLLFSVEAGLAGFLRLISLGQVFLSLIHSYWKVGWLFLCWQDH